MHLDHPNICMFVLNHYMPVNTPNAVRIFDRYTSGKHLYLVLEYMESGSLGNIVRVSTLPIFYIAIVIEKHINMVHLVKP